jgi:formylglycine-generating enzyme required for sulfatase activity
MKNKYFLILLTVVVLATSAFVQDSEDWPEMVKVEGGSFLMGADKRDMQAEKDEKPQNKVSVDAFYMSKFEVTVWEWKQYVKSKKMQMPPKQVWGWNDAFPITNITWEDAIGFCNWLSKKHGYIPAYTRRGPILSCNFDSDGYRLPTEAEWEFAARGGVKTKNYKYVGGNEPDRTAWFTTNSEGRPHVYGTRYANELGIHDLNGNVWEWCWDKYDVAYFADIKNGRATSDNPTGALAGEKRIVKGGSWDSKLNFLRPTNKVATLPGNTFEFYGFRLVRTVNK